ncbi:hypothetical protein HN51_006098 [Arachis hypogaea]|uniref:DUF632 domain-containing protein n=1 Tax=Arachis hypogaea TaxID=3818 RepID=A0A445DC64_ARAHY|nr:BZIP transcription factor [Arachis hypogaea]RYR60743.1 hypothetical protein Ahy_A04g017799 [Arachis hypogaea]
MGCAASKLDNEDTVRRCKDRRRFMKEAVYARHLLAAAHSDYCRSLRLTGSALSTFATGEPLSVSDTTPAVFLHPPPPQPKQPPPPPQQQQQQLPPLFIPSPSPSPSPTIPETKTETARNHDYNNNNNNRNYHNRQNRRKPPKLPHILSDSSPSDTPRSNYSNIFPTAYSTYSTTPSQASSVWNWENFYPPPPPPPPPASDYFDQRSHVSTNITNNKKQCSQIDTEEEEDEEHYSEEDEDEEYSGPRSEQNFNTNQHHHHHQQQHQHQRQQLDDDERSEYDFFKHGEQASFRKQASFKKEGMSFQKQHHLIEDYAETEREEVHCSEWGDHYSTTTSSDDDGGGHGGRVGAVVEEEEEDSRSERSRSNFGSSVRGSSMRGSSVVGDPVTPPPPMAGKKAAPVAEEDDARSKYGEMMEMKMVVRHKDLKEIVEAIKESFDKAAVAGDQVSEMLQISQAQLDRSFKQLRKTVYHSSSLLSNLSSTWSSKPPLAVKYRLDTGSLAEPGGLKSLCSTLERLLAWEKKLYEEVKAREGWKIDHEKKLSALQSQEYKGEDEAKIFKTKTSINKLQSLIIVTSQAVTATSTAIIGLRDSDLVPQLVDLCHGFMYMWRSMHQHHETQSNIVQQVRGLVNRSSRGDSTSELHRQATRDLESAVSAWHSSFCRLIKFQRDFIVSLHAWFKLSLVPVHNDNVNLSICREPNDAYMFFDEWKLALERVPDTVASEAIKSFINVVHVIYTKQSEELKIKKRTESASKELEKKSSSLRTLERKFYNSYSMVGISLPDTGPDNGQGLDARDPLAEKKLELATCQRRVEDEMLRHSKAVEVTRAMTLNNLQTGLPGVFQALTSFSSLFTEALESVCTRSYAIK